MTSVNGSNGRTVVARFILLLAALSAAAASAQALLALQDAPAELAMLAGWRAFGLAVFAGLFILLAWRPRDHPGIFELAIAHKAALAGYALLHPEATDASTVAVADGLLTVTLLGAYLLAGAHRGWSPHTRHGRSPDADASGQQVCA